MLHFEIGGWPAMIGPVARLADPHFEALEIGEVIEKKWSTR